MMGDWIFERGAFMSSGQERSSAGSWGCLWLIVFMSGNMVIIAGIFVAMLKPWYSWEEVQHLANLRQACRGQSIEQFLKENPQWKNDPIFARIPVERPILDKMMWYVVIGGVLWWIAAIYAAFKLPKTAMPKPSPRRPSSIVIREVDVFPQSTELTDAFDIPELAFDVVPETRTFVCAYCGGSVVTELAPRQAMSCPHCGAALKAPNA
jgi:hypothetical protein